MIFLPARFHFHPPLFFSSSTLISPSHSFLRSFLNLCLALPYTYPRSVFLTPQWPPRPLSSPQGPHPAAMPALPQGLPLLPLNSVNYTLQVRGNIGLILSSIENLMCDLSLLYTIDVSIYCSITLLLPHTRFTHTSLHTIISMFNLVNVS